MTIWQSLRRKGLNIFTGWFPYKGVDCPDDELPKHLARGRVYVLGTPAWRVAFLCPCGCKEMVELCLLKQYRPHWTASVDNEGKVSLSPSVWKKVGCRSHYFMRNGQIIWV
ncbi:DUF6527 family protein [Rhodanobacter denitrificans]|uniref:DUF6527 family protein n=1 Tax=Rhodanobacter denitrificans TaxID=666685 RepID=UPI001CB950C8